MSEHNRKHPDREALLRFARGKSADWEISILEQHINQCDQCSAELAKVPLEGDPLVGHLQQLHRARETLDAPEPGIETGIYDTLDTSQPAATGAKTTEPIPQWIGRYRLQKILGQGAFGLVYLAHDEMLQRLVAIKVPHERLVADKTQAEAYLTEARTVASLDHPHIVPVHDVGKTDHYPCFVVSKYIDGTDLTSKLKTSRLTLREAVELVAIVAEALHHAHKQGLVHRDIKPGNILLDRSGKPFVADFGLALREEDTGKGPRFAGTPAYMSPEQARGEGHRVDGRSDVFSLGVVFYQLLVGRLPFRASRPEELLEQIIGQEPRPPRQHDDSIPKELDRICLKALSKRASERYSTAQDMSDELHHFLAQAPSLNSASVNTPSADARMQALIPAGWSGSFVAPVIPKPPPPPVKIIPKGLRSFDAHDADFFLELLPGPRDQDGLPDSIRFWKSRVEETDPDQTFSVGLIYGPSGCGKSSLVKAGLLPRLSDDVIPVYLEATAVDTETRLLNGLRKRCPDLSPNLGLKESIAALRRGQGLPDGKKVVIILDQFEQWLHAKKEEKFPELVQALRQCDGGRVQCIVMVRDDFWLAVSRFLRELEIRLLEGDNSALADLFDLDHARKVLAAFGRAFGRFNNTNRENEEFLKQAVAGLAEEGKVICVRLALFAEMMKGYAWTPATLKEVGGTQGVGITFLEETFSAATAPPHHRLHQQAARSVLTALLPESGTDIKGHMLSQAELLEASGYANRPADFEDLIRMLDGEIRLITPTDLEGKGGIEETTSPVQSGQKYYQLTHDYLVPALRAWLTRKQKETRRGRAELLLADRAGIWYGRRENRQLPSLIQSLQILWWTSRRNWTYPQHMMMSQAAKYYASRSAIILLVFVILGIASRETLGRWEGERLRDRLLESTLADVPEIVQDMSRYRSWVNPLLREASKQAQATNNSRRLLHASLALLPVDKKEADYLYERLLHADPEELVVIRKALFDSGADVSDRLWTLLLKPQNDQDQRFRAACALSLFTPKDPRWEQVSRDVASTLVTQKRFVIAQWTEAFTGAGSWLIVPLADFMADEEHKISDLGVMASIYATYARDLPQAYALLERRLSESASSATSPELTIAAAKKQARIATALMAMGQVNPVWPLLKQAPDPTARSYLIEQMGPGGVDPKLLLSALDATHAASIKRALLLSLGEFGVDHLSLAERRNHVPQLVRIYRDDPDAGIHGSAEWLLRNWQSAAALKDVDAELATGKIEGSRQWYRNRQGQTLVVVPSPVEFAMGDDDTARRVRIGRQWSIGSKEVTIEQYRRFRKEHEYGQQYAPTYDCPVHNVTWFDAASYCNWLSEQEGIPKEQWCYLPNKDGKYESGMTMPEDFLARQGYRLPTEAEWEYACRAGSTTPYAWGRSEEVLVKYAWIVTNSQARSHPAGSLKPNDLGLFDMHGNEWEWCQDAYVKIDGPPSSTQLVNDTGGGTNVDLTQSRLLRGGAFGVRPSNTRSAFRYDLAPTNRNFFNGFRIARTLVAQQK